MAKDKVVEEGMIWGIIAYLWILFLVPLLAKKDNKFALYHAKQGLMLFICWAVILAISAVILAISFAIGWVPILGWIVTALGWIFLLVLFMLFIIGIIIGIVNSASGKYAPLPVVGHYAEKWKI